MTPQMFARWMGTIKEFLMVIQALLPVIIAALDRLDDAAGMGADALPLTQQLLGPGHEEEGPPCPTSSSSTS